MNPSDVKILIVEDTTSLVLTYKEYLASEGFSLEVAATGKEAEEKISAYGPDIVLLDLNLPDKDGMEILKDLRTSCEETKVIVVTANASINIAIEAMQEGAYDFLVKPFQKERLLITVKNAIEQLQLSQEREQLSRAVESYREELDRKSYAGFIGSSPPMQAIYRMIDSSAPSKATVFITGESGTGKEVCARAIHDMSPRADKPFVALNCGAIPKDLIESEVFGHVKGAFTGASSDRDGAASRANGGTLFLDEICEMNMDLQVKLLRFLQTGSFMKVGGEKEEHVDIRIVCATNKDPLEEVQAERFREDLYYRLHVISIHMPPLRSRGDDVIELAESFLQNIAHQEGKQLEGFSEEAKNAIRLYNWPGNVRQLLNVVQNMVVMNEGEQITEAMLPAPLDKFIGADQPEHPRRRATDHIPATLRTQVHVRPLKPENIKPLWEVEKEAIETAIKICEGNIPKAAALLEINPSTIYRKKAGWEEKDQAS